MLVIGLPACTELCGPEMHQPPAEQLSGPAELLVCAVAEAEDSEGEVLEEVLRQVGTEEGLPERRHGAGLASCPRSGNDKYYKMLVNELRLAGRRLALSICVD